MHFKNVYHWVHTLYKKISNTFKSLNDCTSLLRCLCYLCATAVSKPIHCITSCNDILFYFLCYFVLFLLVILRVIIARLIII